MSAKLLTEQERYRYFWREVVYQAVRDLLNPEAEKVSDVETQEAWGWVHADSQQPGSFLWACVQAGLNPAAVRQQLDKRGEKWH